MTTLGVDLGGTTMRAAIVHDDGTIAARCKQPTPSDESCPAALIALMAELPRAGVERVVMGVPGRVDYRRGRLEHAPNLPGGWVDDLNEAGLVETLGCRVLLSNDADLAAVGEARYGAGRGVSDIVYLTISTGVGASVVVDGEILSTGRSIGEIGHLVIDRAAAAAGHTATVEDLASGTAINRALAEADFHLGDRYATDLVGTDPTVDAVWQEAMRAAGLAAVALAHLYSPELIVTGGGVGRHGSLVHPWLRDALERHGPIGTKVELAAAGLGDDAGLIGAAAWHPPRTARTFQQ